MRLAQRLLAGSAILVSVLVLLIVVLSGQRLRARLRELTTDQLAREVRLIAVEWRPGVISDSLAHAAGRALGHRVTLIDSIGRVIGDSEFDEPALAGLQNHAMRPEVMEAVASGMAAPCAPVRRKAMKSCTSRCARRGESRACR